MAVPAHDQRDLTSLHNSNLPVARSQRHQDSPDIGVAGRLDPPLRIVGDEISNVAPVPKLPGYRSNLRGFGLQWWLVFQSVAQVLSCWGEAGGRALMGNVNLSMILVGLQDERALKRFSLLVGNADVVQVLPKTTPLRKLGCSKVSSRYGAKYVQP